MTLDAPAAVDVGAAEAAVGDVHRGLGDAVHVDELRALVAAAVARSARTVAASSASPAEDDAGAAARRGARRRRARPPTKQPRREGVWLSTRDALVDEQLGRRQSGVRLAQYGHHHEPAAEEQRAPDLPDGEVEGVRVEAGVHTSLRPKWHAGAVRREEAHDVARG